MSPPRNCMTDRERALLLYRLNGQLNGLLRRLGACIGATRQLTEEGDGHATNLSRAYDDIKRVQDAIYKKYVA